MIVLRLILAGILLLTLLLPRVQAPTPLDSHQRVQALPCLSYSPFRLADQSPLRPGPLLTAEQIRHDLQQLLPLTPCVRTYGTDQGLDRIPQEAQALGMQVVQGIWLSSDRLANQRQMARGLALAAAYPETIRLLVVGNEVLLRGDLPVQALRQHLMQAQQQTSTPITTADVSAFWERHAADLLPVVDVAAIHLLPYWEDQPVGAVAAAESALQTAKRLQQDFAPVPIWVGEIGWPTDGRQRGPARPGLAEQRRVLADVSRMFTVAGIDFNWIEAFDQPWKQVLEGTVGSAWGLMRADGQPKASLPAQPLNSSEWRSLAGGLLVGLLLWLAARFRPSAWPLIWLPPLLVGAVWALLLATDGRYRDLHWGLAWGVGLGMVLSRPQPERRAWPLALRLGMATGLLAATGWMLWTEGLQSTQALQLALILAGGGLVWAAASGHRSSPPGVLGSP